MIALPGLTLAAGRAPVARQILETFSGFVDRTLAYARLEGVADHLRDAALGQLSEIFDGDPPHRARGAPAQAWSVATVIEAWWRTQSAA